MNDPLQHSLQPLDADRKSRQTTHQPIEVQSLRERAASQPPRTEGAAFPSSPISRRFDQFGALSSVPWSQSARFIPLSRSASLGVPQSVPTRSSSFSLDRGFQTGSAYTSLRGGAFSSTFEDDESEITSDDTSQHNYESVAELNRSYRGRAYSPDNNRSRSQSLAGLRTAGSQTLPLPVPAHPALTQSWKESFLQPNSFSASLIRDNYTTDLKPSLGRVGSYGARTVENDETTASVGRIGFQQDIADISNISPFLRDVNQIFVEDAPIRDLWGPNVVIPKEETWIPGSGTTSRRHSVSVIQPRRGLLGGGNEAPIDRTQHNLVASVGKQSSLNDVSQDKTTDDIDRLHLSFHNDLTLSLPRSTDSTAQVNAAPSIDLHSRHALHSDPTFRFHPAPESTIATSNGHRALSAGKACPRFCWKSSKKCLDRETTQKTNFGIATGESESFSTSNPLGILPMSYPTDLVGNESLRQQRSLSIQNPVVELGKGIPLHSVPSSYPLYIVEFKAGRTDLFYTATGSPLVNVGDLVIVEADRGRDLGKVVNDTITQAELEEWQQSSNQIPVESPSSPTGSSSRKELNPKRIYGKASSHDTQLLIIKAQDEEKALQLCQSKVKQKKLPMDVIDAEYQWDRRKLTFYFIAEKRIDFRELVRELFRLYKTRIWMASLSQTSYVNE